MLTVHSYVGYDRTDTHGYARDAAFDADPSAVGGIDEVLDSAFLLPSSGSARMRWLNRSSTRSLFEEWKYNVGHDMMWDAKLPWVTISSCDSPALSAGRRTTVSSITCWIMLRPGPKPTVATVTTADVGVIIITNPRRNTPSTFRTTGIPYLLYI